MKSRFTLHVGDGSQQILDLAGREEWALSHLLAAGDHGCTPITTPGPRWSDYVFKLRRRGILVDTITEPHAGPYPGTHARYRLRSRIERLTGVVPPPPTAQLASGADHVG